MDAQRFLHTIDGISTWTGKAAAWLIVGLMGLVCAEVFKRYILNMPDGVDLRRLEHAVRHAVHDRRRLHAGAERPCARRLPLLVDEAAHPGDAGSRCSYFVFFLPGYRCAGLCRLGFRDRISWRINEHSNVTADGPPVYHFKFMIPLAGVLVLLQGAAEIMRCVICLQTGAWPSRLADVIGDRRGRGAAGAQRTCRRGDARKAAIAHAQDIEEGRAAARHGRRLAAMSDPALGLLMLGPHRGRDHDGLSDGVHA